MHFLRREDQIHQPGAFFVDNKFQTRTTVILKNALEVVSIIFPCSWIKVTSLQRSRSRNLL